MTRDDMTIANKVLDIMDRLATMDPDARVDWPTARARYDELKRLTEYLDRIELVALLSVQLAERVPGEFAPYHETSERLWNAVRDLREWMPQNEMEVPT